MWPDDMGIGYYKTALSMGHTAKDKSVLFLSSAPTKPFLTEEQMEKKSVTGMNTSTFMM